MSVTGYSHLPKIAVLKLGLKGEGAEEEVSVEGAGLLEEGTTRAEHEVLEKGVEVGPGQVMVEQIHAEAGTGVTSY